MFWSLMAKADGALKQWKIMLNELALQSTVTEKELGVLFISWIG